MIFHLALLAFRNLSTLNSYFGGQSCRFTLETFPLMQQMRILKAAFAEYGNVKRVQVPNDRETGRPRGFAFVEMETEDEETAAINGLDGTQLMGRNLKVNRARPRE